MTFRGLIYALPFSILTIILWALCIWMLSLTRLALHGLEKLRCRNDHSFHGNYDVFSPYPETRKEGKLC